MLFNGYTELGAKEDELWRPFDLLSQSLAQAEPLRGACVVSLGVTQSTN